jgi:hypothetical protein
MGTNPSPPSVFAKSTEIADLLRKHPRVYLSTIAEYAGFKGSDGFPMVRLPTRACLKWITFGKCGFPGCNRDHPTAVDNSAAQALCQAMLPGVKALLALQELPPQQKKKKS